MIYTIAAIVNLLLFMILIGCVLHEYVTSGVVTDGGSGSGIFSTGEVIFFLVICAASILTSVQVLMNVSGCAL